MLDILEYFIAQFGWSTSIEITRGNVTWTPDLLVFGWWAIITVGLWPMQLKAGRSRFDVLVPVVSLYAILKLAGLRGWWLFAYLFPILNIVAAVLVARGLGRNFGRSSLFTVVFLFILQPIGLLILGFGSSRFDPDSPALAARNIRATELA